MEEMKQSAQTSATAETFDAVTIVKSDTYRQHVDILCAELEEDKQYSHDDIKKIIDKALARPVQKDIV